MFTTCISILLNPIYAFKKLHSFLFFIGNNIRVNTVDILEISPKLLLILNNFAQDVWFFKFHVLRQHTVHVVSCFLVTVKLECPDTRIQGGYSL